jgi:hypothetical protein
MKKYFVVLDPNGSGTVFISVNEEDNSNILVHVFPNNVGVSILTDQPVPPHLQPSSKEDFEAAYWNLLNNLNKIVL